MTHVRLANGLQVDILNFLDDDSRLITAAKAMPVATATEAVAVFAEAAARWGFPASLLTDNGRVFTAWHRGGTNVLEPELLSRGTGFRHSRPYRPQTCGKVERFHQTLKAYLAMQPAPGTIPALQDQIDAFVTYYNEVRPHRARGPMTPLAAYQARDKARPAGPKLPVPFGARVRYDRVDADGSSR